jgi:hypothetical protein
VHTKYGPHFTPKRPSNNDCTIDSQIASSKIQKISLEWPFNLEINGKSKNSKMADLTSDAL